MALYVIQTPLSHPRIGLNPMHVLLLTTWPMVGHTPLFNNENSLAVHGKALMLLFTSSCSSI